MLRREDRRDLGLLALFVAVYGLAFAPLVHAVYGHGASRGTTSAALGWVTHQSASPAPHDERVPHSHGPGGKHEHGAAPTGHSHGSGSVEHLRALAVVNPGLPRPMVFWVALGQVLLGSERPRQGVPLPLTAMPQGP